MQNVTDRIDCELIILLERRRQAYELLSKCLFEIWSGVEAEDELLAERHAAMRPMIHR